MATPSGSPLLSWLHAVQDVARRLVTASSFPRWAAVLVAFSYGLAGLVILWLIIPAGEAESMSSGWVRAVSMLALVVVSALCVPIGILIGRAFHSRVDRDRNTPPAEESVRASISACIRACFRRPPPVPSRPRITTRAELILFVAAVLVLFASNTVFGQVDQLLRGFHLPGEAVVGGSSITRFSLVPAPTRLSSQLCDAVVTWTRYAEADAPGAPETPTPTPAGCPAADTASQTTPRDDETPSDDAPDPSAELVAAGTGTPPFPGRSKAPITTLGWQFGVDSLLLVPTYLIIFLLLIAWTRLALLDDRHNIEASARPIDRTGTDDVVVPLYRRLGVNAACAVIVAALFDWSENTLVVWLVDRGWDEYQAGSVMPTLQWGAGHLSWWVPLLVVVTLGKWLSLALVVAYFALAGFLIVRHGGGERRWAYVPGLMRTLLAARVPILIALLFAIAQRPGEVPELIWGWLDADSVAIVAIVFVVLLAIIVGASSQWLLWWWCESAKRQGQRQLPAMKSSIVRPIVIIAASTALIAWALGDSFKPVLPIILIVLIAAAGYPLRDWPEHVQAQAPGLGNATLPPLLAGTILAKMGASVLRAATDLLLYNRLRAVPVPDEWLLPLASLGLFLAAFIIILLWRQIFDTISTSSVRSAVAEKTQEVRDKLTTIRATDQTRRGDAPRGTGATDERPCDCRPGPVTPIVGLVVSLTIWLLLVILIQDQDRLQTWAPKVGPVGLVCVFLILVTLIGSSVIALIDWAIPRPPRIFRPTPLDRTPVVLFLVVWLVLAAIITPGAERLHDVRPQSVDAVMVNGDVIDRKEQLASAFAYWRWQNCLVARAATEVPTDKPTVPLILVATSGGGIRAATWTTQVLDRVIGDTDASDITCDGQALAPSPSSYVFAASGISGGSLGLATWVTHLGDSAQSPQNSETTADASSDTTDWIRAQLHGDFLSAPLAWMLFAETPWLFARTGLDQSRADVLDTTWERAWRTGQPATTPTPLLFEQRLRQQVWAATWQGYADQSSLSAADVDALYAALHSTGDGTTSQAPYVPLLLLNGTSVESGCRFNGSVLDADARALEDPATRCHAPTHLTTPREGVLGATVDLVDFLCSTQDLRLSTAAMLSARFPFLSPAGHLTQCEGLARGEETNARPETYVVDGGYLEGTGATTILALLAALDPFIQQHNQDPLSRAYIVPFMIQIDNNYAEPAGVVGQPDVPQITAPSSTLLRVVSSGRGALARQEAQLVFSRPYPVTYPASGPEPVLAYCGSRYAHFPLLAHPGPQAQLGWVLSDVGIDDLENQLSGKRQAVAAVRDWFIQLSLEPVSSVIDSGCLETEPLDP